MSKLKEIGLSGDTRLILTGSHVDSPPNTIDFATLLSFSPLDIKENELLKGDDIMALVQTPGTAGTLTYLL